MTAVVRCVRHRRHERQRHTNDHRRAGGRATVSRLLSWTAISLGRRSLAGSSTLPGDDSGAGHASPPIRACSGRGLPCRSRHRERGELLPRLFTLTPPLARRGGVFSVALSLGSLPVGITNRLALWRPDFPHPAVPKNDRTQPSGRAPARASGRAYESQRTARQHSRSYRGSTATATANVASTSLRSMLHHDGRRPPRRSDAQRYEDGPRVCGCCHSARSKAPQRITSTSESTATKAQYAVDVLCALGALVPWRISRCR